jgi:hypothetical protein
MHKGPSPVSGNKEGPLVPTGQEVTGHHLFTINFAKLDPHIPFLHIFNRNHSNKTALAKISPTSEHYSQKGETRSK